MDMEVESSSGPLVAVARSSDQVVPMNTLWLSVVVGLQLWSLAGVAVLAAQCKLQSVMRCVVRRERRRPQHAEGVVGA